MALQKRTPPPADVGVIVGRFHVNNLHEAHIELIERVRAWHPKVILFLGLSPIKVTLNNPLDFESRKQMILDKFPDINILYIKDVGAETIKKADEIWSKNLDQQIHDVIGPNQSAVLYGSRDSFIKHYYGKFPTEELESDVYVSGTDIRKQISSKVKSSSDFRTGVIWATQNRYAEPKCTVDALITDDRNRILLVRKPGESLFRFCGGFAAADSESFEQDVRREVSEELHIEISDPEYIGSAKIDDWRFRNEVDKIKTIFFLCRYMFGHPTPDDDIEEAKWFDISDLTKEQIMPVHHPLYDMMQGYFAKKTTQKIS
jgi:bifunctional NMN adenylyltransferase/nudix hydrolase